MITKNYNIKQKQVLLRAYQNLEDIKGVLGHLTKDPSSHLQISVLGKVLQNYSVIETIPLKTIRVMENYWKKILSNTVNFGCFYNPNIGAVYVVGDLVSVFLHKINNKPLAVISGGPYSIFRGLGFSETEAITHLKSLNKGDCLLILRGYDYELKRVENLLGKK